MVNASTVGLLFAHNSPRPLYLLVKESYRKNRSFASCISLRYLIGCYCVLLRKGSEPTETIPGFDTTSEPFFVAHSPVPLV